MYQKEQHIHFVGIGGIGMSSIATILAHQGYRISGCDTDVTQKSIQNLRSYGCVVHEGNNNTACFDQSIDVLVYSSAIKQDSAEMVAAKKRGIPVIHRAVMLAELMRTKYSIAVSGAHGKTTTTAMIAHILMTAQQDPTVIIGGNIKSIDHNARYGAGNFLVAEADESDRSLVKLQATLCLITNIDREHLETYRDIDDIKDTFIQFANMVPFYGATFVCTDDFHINAIIPHISARLITYGLTMGAQVHGTITQQTSSYSDISIQAPLFGIWDSVRLNSSGQHNVQNALGAIAVALETGISFDVIAIALRTFSGVDRRFTYHGSYQGAAVFDDYGHHPTEITHTLKLARMHAQKELTAVFQPHRFIRTQQLWKDFVQVFLDSTINHLIITDIYGAGEQPIEGISGKKLAEELQSCNPHFTVHYVPYEKNHVSIQQAIDTFAQSQDLILLLGAGSINTVAKTLLAQKD